MIDHRHILASLIAMLSLLTLAAPSAFAQPKPASLHVYVGTYTGSKSKGIQLFKFDLATGALTPQGCVAEITHPTFLTIHPDGRLLYAASEIENYARKKSGAVAAYSIDPATGKLTALNKQPSAGGGACHVSVDKTGKFVLVANYSAGNASVLPIQPDGSLAEPSATVQHTGTGPDKDRQEAPHAHSINLAPNNQFAFVADLGIDKVMIYRFDPAKGALTPNDPVFVAIAPGGGPRHLAFHPNGKFAYVNHEMGNAVSAFAYDSAKGALTPIQTLPTLPADFKGQSTTAEILVHPSGKFLYCSNRGHDSIAIYALDPETGKLTALGHEPTGGKEPRNFNIDPTGAYLLAANQSSDSLVVFRIDPETGKLTPTGVKAQCGTPVCIKFLPIP